MLPWPWPAILRRYIKGKKHHLFPHLLLSKIWTKTFKDPCCNCYHWESDTIVNLRVSGDEGHCLGQGPNLLGWKVWWCRHVGWLAAPDVLKEWIHAGCPDWILMILLWTYYNGVNYVCKLMSYTVYMFILYNQITYTYIYIYAYTCIYIYNIIMLMYIYICMNMCIHIWTCKYPSSHCPIQRMPFPSSSSGLGGRVDEVNCGLSDYTDECVAWFSWVAQLDCEAMWTQWLNKAEIVFFELKSILLYISNESQTGSCEIYSPVVDATSRCSLSLHSQEPMRRRWRRSNLVTWQPTELDETHLESVTLEFHVFLNWETLEISSKF